MAVFDNLNKTTSPGVAPSVQEYYDATLQQYLVPNLVHAKDAQQVQLPTHNGKSVRFRKPTRLKAVTTPLSSGVTPDGQKMEMTDFRATVKPYGGYIEQTDELNFYLIDDMHKMAAQMLTDQAKLSIDTILSDAFNAGSNVYYPGEATSRAALTNTNILDAATLKKVVRALEVNNAPKFSDGCYHAIVHPNTKYDLTADPMWVDIAKYQNAEPFESYEIGKMFSVKFYVSTNAKVFTAAAALFGATASLTIGAVDAAKRKLTITANHALITPDVARQLSGMLVDVKATSGAATQESVAIERAEPSDGTNAFIYLRYMPRGVTLAASSVIVPTGGGAAGMPVYATLVYGSNAFGTVSLSNGGGTAHTIINPPGSSGALDPLRQRGTIGWKANGFCGVVLDDLRMVRVEHGVSG